MCADAYCRAMSTFRYRARALCAFLARFSSNSRRRLLVTDSAYPLHERRSLVARLLLVTRSHVHVLCCTVSFSSRRRQRTLQFSPNHVGNFLAPRACLAYILHCTRRVFCTGYNYRQLHKVPIHAIKPFFSRTPRCPTRSSLFLFVPPHFANFRRRTRLSPPPPRFLFRVPS